MVRATRGSRAVRDRGSIENLAGAWIPVDGPAPTGGGSAESCCGWVPLPTAEAASVAAVLCSGAVLADVADVGGWPTGTAAAELRRAQAAGLLVVEGSLVRFESEEIRSASVARLSPEHAADIHDRARRMLERRLGADSLAMPPTTAAAPVEFLERLARHAVAAAGLSERHTELALRWASEAAGRLVPVGRAHDALALLDEVMPLARPAPDLPLRLLHAGVALRAGRLEQARSGFTVAVALARESGDGEALALAAIGLGGLWVNEHRGSSEALRARTVWEDALAGLGEEHEVLRLRLQARLAAEQAYLVVDPSAHRAALQGISVRLRELGETAALVEVLGLWHHACLGPADVALRDRLVREMLPAAYRCGDEFMVLVALCWKTIDAHLAGEPDADRQLAAFRERLAIVDNDAFRYVCELLDGLQAVREGRWDQAERMADSCLATGLEVGDRDAHAYHGAQLLSIRWRQGREAELQQSVDDLVVSPTVADGSIGFVAAQAAIAARAGDADAARRALARMPANGIAGIPHGSGWLVTVSALVEAAQALGDRALAAGCYDALAPYAHLPVVASLAASFGPVERWLSLAAKTIGRHDDAVAHLERAVAACVTVGDPTMHAQLSLELADLRRGEAAAPALSVVRNGRRWVVGRGSCRAVVRDLVGLAYLAQLAQCSTGMPALELAAAARAVPAEFRSDQPVLDRTALAGLRRGLADLETDLAEAAHLHDAGRLAVLEAQREAILAELGRVLNVNGTSRSFAGPAERARISVRKALLRAVDEVEAVDARLGAELRTALHTGHVCSLQW